MIVGKRPPHRIFDYEPRFYDPETDDSEKRKKRLKFRYARQHARKKRSPVVWLILILLIAFIYLKFAGLV